MMANGLFKRLAILPVILGFAFGVTQHSTATANDTEGFHWVIDEERGTADLLFGDQPALRYMFAYDDSTPERLHETYKPYHHVFGPGTEQLITKGAGGQFTHHRGLYVGWNKTGADGKSYDFWHCTAGAHQKHVKFLAKEGNADRGTMTAEIHWNDPEGNPVVREIRTVTVSKIEMGDDPGYGWQIDWQTTLHSERGTITLNGDRQHAGFQYRAAQAVAESNGARYIRPADFPQRAEAVQVGDQGDPPPHINLNWFAMTYELDGERYTAEYLEDPSLPKPSLYSERPYGRFGAFFKTTLAPEEPLTMRYRVVVSRGPSPERDDIQARYDAFVSELKAD